MKFIRFEQRSIAIAAVSLFCGLLSLAANAVSDFALFESGQVRPLALAHNGSRLFAINTPDNRLEVFRITRDGIELEAEVPVGLEPVAVAVRNEHEVWVVNHLSDSVSVVSLHGTPRVVRTLLVGDEPRDIVFAGRQNTRAFITTAHRGQHRLDPSLAGVPGAGDPQLTTPGVGRADVWVFDATRLNDSVGGTPVKIVTLFGDTPRALAVSPDNKTVYAAIFKSGNQTASLDNDVVCDGFMPFVPCAVDGKVMPGGLPGPSTNRSGAPAPEVGMIVKFNNASGHWEDTLGRNWDNGVRFRLPDLDVFAIDAESLQQTAAYPHVGTTLYNMATNPVTGKLYVSNTEAFNQVRFEGPGVFGGSTVQGHLAESRITVISDGQATPRHLNKHIDYSILADNPKFDPGIKNHSLATPTDMVVSRDGKTLYVAAFGSSKIGVFSTRALESDRFDPRTASRHYINVSGGGPSGVALDEEHGRLYVLTRFDNSISVVDLRSRKETAHVALYNPEPAAVVRGRPLLYDAVKTSANGEASCASCHIFGDMDDVAWDLGNPDDEVTKNPLPIRFAFIAARDPHINGTGLVDDFHPMKGPMTTQTLRGMANSAAMHWRGDRSNGVFGMDAFDSNLSFLNFTVAFRNLLGAPSLPSRSEMQTFADFQLKALLPPNPNRPLNNTLTPSQQRGRDFFFGSRRVDGFPTGDEMGFTCGGCHPVDPARGIFGAAGPGSFEVNPQIVKIPHLRNLYQKIGMFGMPRTPLFISPDPFFGDQVRGFGYRHDGTVDTVFRFIASSAFITRGPVGFPPENPDAVRHDVEQFVFAFDTDLAPVVGQQVTLTRTNADAVNPRIDLLIERAGTPFVSKMLGGAVTECDLVAKVAVRPGVRQLLARFGGDDFSMRGRIKGFLYEPASRTFRPDDGSPGISDAELRQMARIPGQEVTYTCVPPGSGTRIGINRTLGAKLDGERVRQ